MENKKVISLFETELTLTLLDVDFNKAQKTDKATKHLTLLCPSIHWTRAVIVRHDYLCKQAKF